MGNVCGVSRRVVTALPQPRQVHVRVDTEQRKEKESSADVRSPTTYCWARERTPKRKGCVSVRPLDDSILNILQADIWALRRRPGEVIMSRGPQDGKVYSSAYVRSTEYTTRNIWALRCKPGEGIVSRGPQGGKIYSSAYVRSSTEYTAGQQERKSESRESRGVAPPARKSRNDEIYVSAYVRSTRRRCVASQAENRERKEPGEVIMSRGPQGGKVYSSAYVRST